MIEYKPNSLLVEINALRWRVDQLEGAIQRHKRITENLSDADGHPGKFNDELWSYVSHVEEYQDDSELPQLSKS